MRFFPKVAIGAAVVCGVALHGELTKWAENVDSGSRLEAVFFRTVLLPSGAVPVRRPPKETRPALTKLIQGAPSDAELYSLRALEDEQQLDFPAAEADWKKNIEVASDKGAAMVALADFYHRRLRAEDEFGALTFAAREYAPDSEKLLPVEQQRPWRIYERLIRLIDEQRMSSQLGVEQYGQWIIRYPDKPALYKAFFDFAIAQGRNQVGEEIVIAYRKTFPKDEEFPVEAGAELAAKVGPAGQAIAVYETNFRADWPAAMVAKYFELLKQTGTLRVYLEKARAGVAANPGDLTSAARLFYYWQQQGNVGAAERVLAEYRERKKTWSAEELFTLGRLNELVHDYDEAARNYYALYSVGQDERGLASLARLLLTAPEQGIHFGAGNLSLYHDVATMDPHPGFLNGALSLILNGTDPSNREAMEAQSAAPYFRRARAAELVSLLEARFPNSTERAGLRELVIETYAIYGSSDGVIRAGAKYLTDFPAGDGRVNVAMRMADAYARLNRTQQEFALYDALLIELGKKSQGVPLGEMTPKPGQTATPRSAEYARVLDRYVARLVSMKRVRDALAIYRKEIDRNPNDPGLYDTLAAFLEQNKLGAETEQVYQKAMAQFQDHSWQSKLARWYLRQRRQADLTKLTRDVIRIFSGTELEAYFSEIVHPAAPVGPALYLQLNLFAHQRFPHQLSFVHNLLAAYSTKGTLDDSAYETLLRRHWYDSEDLRMRFFERLSRTGRLDAELSLVRTSNPAAAAGKWDAAMDANPAAVRMLAEGEAWRGHYEAAGPMMVALDVSFPADTVIARRTASVERSLGAIDTSVAVETKLSDALPRDAGALTRLGEIEADRERFDKAAGFWNRIPQIEPAKAESYLDTATVFWDYYRYEDALRWIDEGRKRLGKPALFAYEAGAIRENQRSYEFAVREYAKGAIAQPGSNAERRLLLLARRAELRPDIETLTANLVSARNPEMGALRLRVTLLRTQNRRDDLEKFLLAVAGRTNVPELLSEIQNDGRVDGYPAVQQAAIEREIAVSTDPVEKMRLRLGLARFFEGQGDKAREAQTVDALYRDYPAILGVVRAAVDDHWRNGDRKRAIDVLEEAAGRAAAEYRTQFTLEAARKSIEAGDYARGRAFAAKLLAAAPDRAEYIAVMADTYARAGDDRGLRAFYDAKIRELGAAKKTDEIAEMRRSLIPVLTRMKDFAGGVDQYIEVLNKYPDDEGLAREAAQYAASNGAGARLRDFYTKATADSPKDYRWPMVLGRIETQMEDFPAAIAAYTKAAGVRPDRADLLMERLGLEERLLRFDEAAATAAKLYELTYRNADWMERLAEIRARQGRSAEAVAALTKARIEGRPESAQNFEDVAEKLEGWGMIAEARRFADEALKRSPDEGLRVWTRIVTKQREYGAALPKIAAGVARAMAIVEMGTVVDRYYAPEEKAKFAAAIDKGARWIELAQSAGLVELQAKWLGEKLMGSPEDPQAAEWKETLVHMQTQRLAFNELGAQLEAYAKLPVAHTNEWQEAADAYRAAGNAAAELRVLQAQFDRAALQGPAFERYAQLMLAQPARMVAAIGRETRAAQANLLLNYVVQRGSAAMVQQAIAARGAKEGPLWTKAYTGLAGLYFASNTAPVRAAFTGVLGEMTIGARVGKPLDRTQQLAGDLWFYYGGRYGEYLSDTKQAGAEDFLPAMVEATPGRSEAYFTLAEETHSAVDYRYALELNPLRADAHDRLAMLAAPADEKTRQWRLALGAFTEMMNRSRVPQAFWTDLSDTLRHIGEAKALPGLRDDVDKLLRLYIRRNGAFQVEGLLQGAYAAAGDPAAGIAWVADLSKAAADPVQFLGAVMRQDWVPEAQKDVLYRRLVESAQAAVASSFGEAHAAAQNQLWTWQIEWAKELLARRENARASEIVGGLEDARKTRAQDVIPLEIRVAARNGTLPTQLAKYREPLPVEVARSAEELLKDGDAAGSRRVLEFVYTLDLKNGKLDASTFLGLAEIRLQERDVAGAMALLRRMTLVGGDWGVEGQRFAELEPAAALLEKSGHATEAAEFLTELVKAMPWNLDARARLAAIQGNAAEVTAVAKAGDAQYAARVSAALAIRRMKAAELTGTDAELMLLSSQSAIGEAEAGKPYFVAARIEAARESKDAAVRERLLRGAIAIDFRGNGPKLDLFKAATEARHDALAIAVGRAMLPQFFAEEGEYTTWVADGFLSEMPEADRVAVARGLGQAHQRLGEVRTAAFYFEIAQRIAPDPRVRADLTAARAQLAMTAANEARRPVISDELDQDRLVRAKVTR